MAGTLWPRLLDLPGAARYLSCSVWTVRDLEAAGTLARVRLGTLRKVLYDRDDLDRVIATSKEGPA